MMASTCIGPRPCCDASATMPAISRMPVIAKRERKKTFTNSQRIIRCRMLTNTQASVPAGLNSGGPGARGDGPGRQASAQAGRDVIDLLVGQLGEHRQRHARGGDD